MGSCSKHFPRIRRHAFKVIVFDWDGTAVKDRVSDASEVISVLEELLKLETYVVVITGTNLNNIDRQFSSHINGPHKRNLFICTNRGSEVFGFDQYSRPVLHYRREASDEENELLDKVAEAVKSNIESKSNVSVDIVYQRLNRRKIDLIPEWVDPPKSEIGELIMATEERLKRGGLAGGIKEAFTLAEHYAKEFGLEDARITSDVKHVEVGLTDKSDSMRWILDELVLRSNTPFSDVLVIGDEFGPVAGFEGSDFRMVVPEAPGITYLSVGKEPNGVPPQVLHLGGGPPCFLQLMREQVTLLKKMVPSEDDTLTLVEVGYNPIREREIESYFTVGNGYLGTRGSLAEQERASTPATLVAGIYDRVSPSAIEELVVFPDWLYTRVYVDGERLELKRRNIVEHRRILDMSKGLVCREWLHEDITDRLTLVRLQHFASLADQHALVMRITVVPRNYRGEIKVETGLKMSHEKGPGLQGVEMIADEGEGWVMIKGRTIFTGVEAAQAQKSKVMGGYIKPTYRARKDERLVQEEWSWIGGMGQGVTIEKYVSIFTSNESQDVAQDALQKVEEMKQLGYEELLLQHVDAWASRFHESSVLITGDRDAQKWINFATYHLISAGNPRNERVSIGARALTGMVYKGHIFWDSEIYILPFFIFTHPPTAHDMLMYRYHTLPGARQRARENGYQGALYAWESTITGEDMTPPAALAPTGEVIPINSGKLEHHINAAIAYGVWSYWNSTRDEDFFIHAAVEILVETARFWRSRVVLDGGLFHIYDVMGPDEFHERVDDNFYTNFMAAWNLRRAVEAVKHLREYYPGDFFKLAEKISLSWDELEEWERVADHMYLDMESEDGIIEQFAGFFDLQEIDVRWYEPRTAPVDVILGRENVAQIQLVKQADVVLALYLVEEAFPRDIVEKNFLFYDVRTSHSSSLSPSIYGLVAARLGLMSAAMRYFRRAGQIDLADNMGNAAGGVHAAALGGLWQQIVMGFAGIRTDDQGIWLYPLLPSKWRRLRFSLLWRGVRLKLDIQRGRKIQLVTEGKGTINVGILNKSSQVIEAGKRYISSWRDNTWDEFVAGE